MSNTPNVLTDEEADRILNAIKHPAGPQSLTQKSFRNYLLTLFMLETGLRVSEVIQLQRYMIFNHDTIPTALTVEAKIAKLHRSRIIPLSQRLKDEIAYLIKNIWVMMPSWEVWYVFPGNKSATHITARRIQQIINTAGMATLGRKVWPHVFRHTFATRLMRVTSARIVQKLLGHKNLTSTQIYTHPNSQDLISAIDKM